MSCLQALRQRNLTNMLGLRGPTTQWFIVLYCFELYLSQANFTSPDGTATMLEIDQTIVPDFQGVSYGLCMSCHARRDNARAFRLSPHLQDIGISMRQPFRGSCMICQVFADLGNCIMSCLVLNVLGYASWLQTLRTCHPANKSIYKIVLYGSALESATLCWCDVTYHAVNGSSLDMATDAVLVCRAVLYNVLYCIINHFPVPYSSVSYLRSCTVSCTVLYYTVL